MATEKSISIGAIDIAAISALPALQSLTQAIMSQRNIALTHALNEVRAFTRTEQKTQALSACTAVLTRAVRALNHVPQASDDAFIVQCTVVDSSGAPVPGCKLVLTDSDHLLDQLPPASADGDGYMTVTLGKQQFSRLFDAKASVYAKVLDPSGAVISQPSAGVTVVAKGVALLNVVMPPSPTLLPIDTVVPNVVAEPAVKTEAVAQTATARKTAPAAKSTRSRKPAKPA